ncbi:MAG: hypothetical protein WD990_00900 [Acidimicrobiia bacterium]
MPGEVLRSVLVFDNTKFAFANYQAARDELVALLITATVTVVSRSIRGGLGVGLADLADELASLGHDAVVLGFADAGVTPATTRLALLLRDRRIPTVVLAGDPGVGLARQIAELQVPDLPIVHLPLRQWMTASEARAVARESFPSVIAALETPPPLTSAEPARVIAVVPFDASAGDTFEWLLESGLTDGLPVIPPTEPLVERMLGGRSPDRILISDLAPSGQELTVGHAALASVLAGCAPQHFSFVVTALEAMAAPEFALWQTATSTNPSGTLIVASGPLADDAGIHSGLGCLGPGFRANATIGRAANLALILAGGAIPGVGNLATQGSPAQYSYCFAENLTLSPWPGLHADRFGPDSTTVTVFHGEGPHNVVDMVSLDASGILAGIASTSATLGSNNTYLTGELMVILCPDHAEIIARSGWTKRDVQEYLFENVRLPAELSAGHGQVAVRPDWANALDPVPAILDPDAVTVVVAGGHGGHSSVALPWAMNRSVTLPLSSPDARPTTSTNR